MSPLQFFFSSSFFLNSFFLDFKASHVLEKCHDCDVFFHKAFKSLDHEFEQDICKNGLVTIHTPFPFCRQNKAHGSSFIYSLSMSYINNNIRFDCLGSQGSNDTSLQKNWWEYVVDFANVQGLETSFLWNKSFFNFSSVDFFFIFSWAKQIQIQSFCTL